MAEIVPFFPLSKPQRRLGARMQPELAHRLAQPGLCRVRLDPETAADVLRACPVRGEAAQDVDLAEGEIRAEVNRARRLACLILIGSVVGFWGAVAWVVG